MYEYTTEKSKFSGWKAKTIISLDKFFCSEEKQEVERILTFTTTKNDTVASVSVIVPRSGYSMEKHAIFGDYHKRVMGHSTIKRSTEKAIINAHIESFELFQKHIDAAKLHYANQG